MTSDLIRRAELLELYEGLDGQGLKVPVEVVVQNIKDIPAVEVIDVHSEIDINNEVLSVSKPPESSIKNMLARNLVEELEQYITVKKHPGMFHNTIFHARVDLVMLKGEEDA